MWLIVIGAIVFGFLCIIGRNSNSENEINNDYTSYENDPYYNRWDDGDYSSENINYNSRNFIERYEYDDDDD